MGALSGAAPVLLLTWQYSAVVEGPMVAVVMGLAFFLFRKYPFGQTTKAQEKNKFHHPLIPRVLAATPGMHKMGSKFKGGGIQ
jgi:hypothetical protein